MSKQATTEAMMIFAGISDPRMERTKVHSLEVILFIALSSTLSGAQGFYEMEDYAKGRKEWLRKNIGMVSVPSHDTFNRVFQVIPAESMEKCLVEFSARLRKEVSGEVVAFDGKTHRRSGGGGKSALHVLNAWAGENRLALGQLAVGEKSNEITAMPLLMEMLVLKGCVVTSDALNTQKAVAAKAVEKEADYVLALKGNHPLMHEEVSCFMDDIAAREQPGWDETEKDHGRIERRRCWQSEEVDWYEGKDEWKGLRSFVLIESERIVNGARETQRRYYISSLGRDEKRVAKCVRSHWLVENALHWSLDVTFGEDQSRARAKNSAKNLGILRVLCLNILKRIPGKSSLRSKMFQNAINLQRLLQSLAF